MAVDKHIETAIIPGMRLGIRPRDPAREVLRLRDFLTGVVPAYPAAVDYFTRVPKWRLGRNREFSTCGPTSLANLKLLVSTWLTDTPVVVTDDQIIDLYRRSGNPDFDPATGAGDNGVDMTVMLSAAIRGGIGGCRPLAFALVDGTDPAESWAAGSLFGGALWAADLTTAQQAQTGTGLWDYVPGSGAWGGHAVLAAGRYTSSQGAAGDRTGLISWAAPLDSTDEFVTRQVRERYVVIFEEHLGSREFLAGVDLTKLAAGFKALTGRDFPITPPPVPKPAPLPPPPVPVPVPPPAPTPPTTVSPADTRLAAAIPPEWLKHPFYHPWDTETVAKAVQAWLTATGLRPGA